MSKILSCADTHDTRSSCSYADDIVIVWRLSFWHHVIIQGVPITSDVNKAKTSRPRPELRGRGQFLEVEAKVEAKNNYEKVPNND